MEQVIFLKTTELVMELTLKAKWTYSSKLAFRESDY